MDELTDGREPIYFYLVEEHVTTFGKDEGRNEPISYAKEFNGPNLRKCKEDAEA